MPAMLKSPSFCWILGLNNVSVRSSINGETPLHWAKNAETTRLLLDAEADVNACDDDGETPLFKVIRGRYVYQIYEEQAYYVECREKDTCSTNGEYKPTSNVTYEETIVMIDFLIEYGADVKGLHDRDGNFGTRSSLLEDYLIEIEISKSLNQ